MQWKILKNTPFKTLAVIEFFSLARYLHLCKQITQTAMKTSTTIKIFIITFFVVLSNVSFAQDTKGTEVKSNDTKETKQEDVVRSKRGPQPTMTVVSESKSYLV